jgi:hypothetical protein
LGLGHGVDRSSVFIGTTAIVMGKLYTYILIGYGWVLARLGCILYVYHIMGWCSKRSCLERCIKSNRFE